MYYGSGTAGRYCMRRADAACDLTSHFQDGGHDVISPSVAVCECTRSVPSTDAVAYAVS